MHRFRSIDICGGKDGWSEIDVEGEVIIGRAVLAFRHARIVDDEWNSDAFLVGIPFVGESMFRVVVAVVGGEDDERVIEDSLLLEGGENFAADRVDLGGKAVVILHHGLIFFRSVEAPVIANTAFVFISEEVGEVVP